jgi:hypothetical protein
VVTAERLGAVVLGSADDLWTRHALLRDPRGAAFTVSQFTPPGDFQGSRRSTGTPPLERGVVVAVLSV